MRTIITVGVLLLATAAANADQKQKPAPVERAKVKPPAKPDYVERVDALEALLANAELRAAQARVEAAQAQLDGRRATWQSARAKLIEKYAIDPDRGEGWTTEPDGRLKARRVEVR